jgi:hypothetical protein
MVELRSMRIRSKLRDRGNRVGWTEKSVPGRQSVLETAVAILRRGTTTQDASTIRPPRYSPRFLELDNLGIPQHQGGARQTPSPRKNEYGAASQRRCCGELGLNLGSVKSCYGKLERRAVCSIPRQNL